MGVLRSAAVGLQEGQENGIEDGASQDAVSVASWRSRILSPILSTLKLEKVSYLLPFLFLNFILYHYHSSSFSCDRRHSCSSMDALSVLTIPLWDFMSCWFHAGMISRKLFDMFLKS